MRAQAEGLETLLLYLILSIKTAPTRLRYAMHRYGRGVFSFMS